MPDEQNPKPGDEAKSGSRDQSDPKEKPFVPKNLDRTVIAIPLLNDLKAEDDGSAKPKPHKVIIDLNLEFPGGRDAARSWVIDATRDLIEKSGAGNQDIQTERARLTPQYVFATLRGSVIRRLVSRDAEENSKEGSDFRSRAIYHIWPDFEIRALTTKSISTVKADAARASFAALGESIVWAVMDSGIDIGHRHFKLHSNTALPSPLEHLDFTGENNPTKDLNGHGTHVAGIIGGEIAASNNGAPNDTYAVVRGRDEQGEVDYNRIPIPAISGMTPKCKLVSLRVLSLLGTRDTGPWAWDGHVPDLEAQVRTSVKTTMRGKALPAEQVRDQLQDRISLIVDGGASPRAVLSTIVHFNHDESWEILREGAIPAKDIVEALA